MNQRGFTLIELAFVVSLMGILGPAIFMMHRNLSAEHRTSISRIQAANSARAISEEIRRDMRLYSWAEQGMTLTRLAPKCTSVAYVVEHGALIRRVGVGCGPSRALAQDVEKLERTAYGLRIHFKAPFRTHAGVPTTIEIAFAGGEL